MRGPRAVAPRSRAVHELGLDYPAWVPLLITSIVVGFGLLTVTHGSVHPLTVVLVGLSLVPFVLEVIDVDLPRLPFALASLVPLMVLNLGGEALGITDLTDEDHTSGSLMIAIFVVGEMAATARPATTVLAAVLAIGTILGRGLIQPEFDGGLFFAGGALVALGMGFLMRRQAETTYELRRAHEALARDAVVQERQRIAREVHDVIAHSLTVTMMHVTAARMAARRDPAQAEEALVEAERIGRQALADVRRTVGLLRTDDQGPIEPPQPDADDLGALVAAYAAAGVDVALDVDGDVAALPPAASLAVFRIVQESLANVARHAPGAAASVQLRIGRDEVTLRVANGAPGRPLPPGGTRGGGMGLVGMHERAALLGGTLDAGPSGDGWEVVCRFPRVDTAADPVAMQAAP